MKKLFFVYGSIISLLFIFILFYSIKNKVEFRSSYQVIPPISSTCSFRDVIKFNYYKPQNSLWKNNNKFGLYIYAENLDYFEIAQNLVNSNGGRWGYVLIPYNVSDRDSEKWQKVFKILSEKELIPIIQLWDINLQEYKKDTRNAAEFLNQNIWPIRYKYISVYNEPNDPNFWYGKADAAQYAEILDYTIETFKKADEDFYILNGAFNTSAGSDGKNIDAFTFMKDMNSAVPGIFDKLDGWASHSYPQPNFSGNPHNSGRWSIKAYDVELDYLNQVLGVKKELPVFITETGWAHAEGIEYEASYLPVDTISDNFKTAYEEIWLKDSRVRAVTPFTIWYDKPYDHFSWINQDKVGYQHYEEIKSLPKVAGDPPRFNSGKESVTKCP